MRLGKLLPLLNERKYKTGVFLLIVQNHFFRVFGGTQEATKYRIIMLSAGGLNTGKDNNL